jgi:hypothetical protein
MAILDDLTVENLKNKGLEGFGFTMPFMSQKWCNQASVTVSGLSFDQAALSLNLSSNTWLAPFSGLLQVVNTTTKKIHVNLQKADGTMVNENGILIRLFPQQILRLKRIFRNLFEDTGTHNTQFASGLSLRQVPAYLFIATAGDTSSTVQGMIDAKEDTGFNGDLKFFDEHGYIIHPLFVASALKTILAQHVILNIDSTIQNQLNDIIDKVSTESNTVRFVNPDGTPYDGSHLTGVTALEAASGLYTINAYTGSDTTLKGEIKRAADTGNSGAFPLIEAQQQLMGIVSYSRLNNIVNIPKLHDLDSNANTNSLKHDFFTVKVVKLKEYLLGSPNTAYNGTKLEPVQPIRLNEQLKFLGSGNEVMGRLTTIFSGGPTQSFLAATAIDQKLTLPADETNVNWPAFPPLSGSLVADDEGFPSDFKTQLQANGTASFIDSLTPPARNVLLRLQGLPKGAAVRVYNRVFLEGANIERGDGAGAVAGVELSPAAGRTFNGEAVVILKDPLGIMRPDGTFVVPGNPKLICDIMIVMRNTDRKRLFGALTFNVASPVTAPAVPPDNILAGIPNKGISSAGILGLNNGSTPSIDLSGFNSMLNSILSLSGEVQPRDASRLPTMMRRELLAAAQKGTAWQALISGGPVNNNLHNSGQEIGCPGSPGGKENTAFGIYSENARLSYDLARMAFRRTNSFYDRIGELADSKWNEPAANTALGETAATTNSVGTFAGSVLQNISPFCETPELALLKSLVESNINSIPATFDDLVNLVAGWINGINTGGLPGLLQTGANKLKTALVTQLNNLKDNTALNESDKERLYNELKRELSSCCFGRRDSQWAVEQAFRQAREFIYIETPGLSFTEGTHQDYSLNLWNMLKTQLNAKPGLRVILCVPKKPDYNKTYDQWIRSEVKERYQLVQGLPASQVVCFHPIGFPGRPNNVENNVIIIDDQWALIGSSAMRRRGLTFDGSTDLVFTDFDIINGHAVSIRSMRRQLLAQRLGITGSATGSTIAVLIEEPVQTFKLIREMLVAGGLGKIERLWNGRTEGITFAEPTIDRLVANPDGNEFSLLNTLLNTAIAGLAT